MKASREEIDQSIKEAFNMNRQESNERTERKSLTYYLGDNRRRGGRTTTNKSSIRGNRLPRSNSFRVCTAHRECNHSTAYQCQDETGNARSLQTGVPCSDQIERPKGGLSEQGDTGACRLHRPQTGRQGQQPFKFCGEYRAHSFGGIR